MSLEEIIAVARGLKPADLVIHNARVVDVLSPDLVATDVAVHAGRVAGLGRYEGENIIDLEGRFLCPGFIDAHLHIESAMLTPPEFARAVSPRGTTAAVCDPHEIANVLGIEGINYMLRSSASLPVTIYVMLPSCVPATSLETSGAVLTSGDLALMLGQERILGIAEMMNYPGVLGAGHEALNKIRVSGGRRVDGHAPGVTGKDLCAYIGAGIHSDHECVTGEEAREKLRLGMYIMAREGSTARNLKELIGIITPENSRRFMHCSDDRSPGDLINKGHIDRNIRLAIQEGLEPLTAIQMATINTAEYFGLKDVGAVAPGFRADFAVLDDLEDVSVSKVIKDGHVVSAEGRAMPFEAEPPGRVIRGTVNIKDSGTEKLKVKAAGSRVKVIDIVADQIVTGKLLVDPAVDGSGFVIADPERDILKIAVFERHRASGNVGVAFIRGIGLDEGAIATSVAHDSHNLVVAGVTDADIRAAVDEIVRMQGGAAVVADGQALASLPLPVAGLMSDRPAKEVAADAQKVMDAARGLGCRLPRPLITLSFMALPVIPSLKITDLGLVDVERFEVVPLFE
ncbi:MAG: adenine deaminase [Thermoleophilia bacterium]|nr:adenine deaminase [Thermoleophilia bacterium]